MDYSLTISSGSIRFITGPEYLLDEVGNYLTDEGGNYILSEESYIDVSLLVYYKLNLESGLLKLIAGSQYITDEEGNYLTDEDGNYLITEESDPDSDIYLLVAHKINISSGSYTLTLSDIYLGLSISRILSINSGTFTLTSSGATNYITDEEGNYLTDEVGNYLVSEDSLSTSGVSFLVKRRINLDSGVLALSGTDVALVSGAVLNRTLSIDPGNFVLSGIAINLVYLGPDQTPGEVLGIYKMAAQYDDYRYNKVSSNVYKTNIVYDDYRYSVDGNKIYVNKLRATINEYMKEDVIHVHKVVKLKSVKVYNYVQ